MFPVVSPSRSISSTNEDETVDSSFALGELAQLTVNNDAENSYDVSSRPNFFPARLFHAYSPVFEFRV